VPLLPCSRAWWALTGSLECTLVLLVVLCMLNLGGLVDHSCDNVSATVVHNFRDKRHLEVQADTLDEEGLLGGNVV